MTDRPTTDTDSRPALGEDETLTIREMCDRYCVTPRTLRFYEAKELLAPIRQGTRRLFTRRDRARLKLILRGKRFGFALEEIRQLLDLYELDDQQYTQLSQTYKIGQSHLENMKRQREELDEAIADFEEQLSWGLQTLERLKGEEDAA